MWYVIFKATQSLGEQHQGNEKLTIHKILPYLFQIAITSLECLELLGADALPRRFYERSGRYCLKKNDGQIILDYPGKPNVITSILQEKVRQKKRSE